MLFIPDIHINPTYKTKIIDAIKHYISANPEEKNLIFLWDYVYHFSYDRNSMMELYNMFFELFSQWKNVYVLAWNHDRIWNSFVFQEAQKAFDIINHSIEETKNFWKIFFITKPLSKEIEWKKIFFLPSIIEKEQIEQANTKSLDIQEQINLLNNSENKNEQLSWNINQILLGFVQENTNQETIIVHHYYFNNTIFPWQKSRFSFKDISLSEKFFDLPNIKFISWHLHQSFVYKNYLCTGSLRSTSPLESNQIKYLFKLNTETQQIEAEAIHINPYIVIENNEDKKVDQESINTVYQNIYQNSRKNLTSPEWTVQFSNEKTPNFKDINLIVKVWDIDYKNIDTIVDEELRKSIKDIKLKKDSISIQDLMQDFQTSTKELSTSFGDWKIILKAYLEKKYQWDYPKYEKMLQELKLI